MTFKIKNQKLIITRTKAKFYFIFLKFSKTQNKNVLEVVHNDVEFSVFSFKSHFKNQNLYDKNRTNLIFT